MKDNRHMKSTFVWVAMVAVAAGCATPKYLVGDGLLGSRGEKTILVPTVGDKKQVLYDYVLRVCDLDANGASSNCKDTTVLSNVAGRSVY